VVGYFNAANLHQKISRTLHTHIVITGFFEVTPRHMVIQLELGITQAELLQQGDAVCV